MSEMINEIFKPEDDRDKIIALQRKKIEELVKKLNAYEQEIALLHYEIKHLKKGKK